MGRLYSNCRDWLWAITQIEAEVLTISKWLILSQLNRDWLWAITQIEAEVLTISKWLILSPLNIHQ